MLLPDSLPLNRPFLEHVMAFTPGSDAICASASFTKLATLDLLYPADIGSVETSSRCSRLYPRSTLRILRRLRTSNPAAKSTSRESATWPVTSNLPQFQPAFVLFWFCDPDFNVCATATRRDRNAGI